MNASTPGDLIDATRPVEPAVRLAREQDLPVILEILNRAIATPANLHLEPFSLDRLQQMWRQKDPRHAWLVADSRREVIGYAATAEYKARRGYRFTADVAVYVHHDYRRSGIGRILYAELIRLAKKSGLRTLVAMISIPNDPSEKFHSSFGFERIGVLREVGYKRNRWVDVAVWQLILTDKSPQ